MPKSESVKRSPGLEVAPAPIKRQQRHIDAMRPLGPATADDIWVRSLHLFQDEGEIGIGLVTSRGTVTLLLGEARARELIAGLNELVEQCRSWADSDAP
jgi:hypothetical protein